jgi:hypothetical protein
LQGLAIWRNRTAIFTTCAAVHHGIAVLWLAERLHCYHLWGVA